MYTIDYDQPKAVITVKLTGMMSLDEAARYIAELKRLLAVHRPARYTMVIDFADFPIQAQDLVRAMGDHIATMPKSERLAIVVATSLARIQVRRLFTQPYARIVGSIAQARAWAIDGVEPAEDRVSA